MLGWRLFVTLGAPVAMLVAAEHLLLPGIAPELVEPMQGSLARLSVFALGIVPITWGYVLVEMVAFLVPGWSRLRLENPGWRAQFDLAVRWTVVALTVVQSYGMALFLEGVAEEAAYTVAPLPMSRLVMVMGLATGVAVQFAVAQWISRQGLVNGLVALGGAELLYRFIHSAAGVLRLRSGSVTELVPHELDMRSLLFTVLELIVNAIAVWIALRGRRQDGERAAEDPIAARKHSQRIGACLGAAAVLYAVWFVTSPTAPRRSSDVAPIRLEVVRIDDTVDPFEQAAGAALDSDARVEIESEQVPAGPGTWGATRYARIHYRENESERSAIPRLRRSFEPLRLPPSTRFGFQQLYGDDGQALLPTGVRSYVLTGGPAFESDDVVNAEVMESNSGPEPDVFLRITLSPDAAERFAAMTGAWIGRRVAISIDDEIISAPMIADQVSGGRVVLNTSPGNYASKLAQAKRWEAGLRRP